MKEMKELLNQENLDQVKQTVEKVVDQLPEEVLDKVAGSGNPFDKIPRVPLQPIDDELREDAWSDAPAGSGQPLPADNTGAQGSGSLHRLRERGGFSAPDADRPGQGDPKAQKRASFFAADLKTDRGQPDDHTNDTGKVK